MINERIMHYANFNITYGEKSEPMLTHFEDIVWPAFCSEFKRSSKNNPPYFYFTNLKIKEIDGELVLVGNYIKETHYDVVTTVVDRELISSPSVGPTAPYSRFIIFLKNHRMILVRNESQSPDIRSFQSTVRYFLKKYIREKNRTIERKEARLPKAVVNIVDIPLSQDIDSVLSNVEKVQKLKMRFFPLNNDLNPGLVAQRIDSEMKSMNCSGASVQFTSPKSKMEVSKLIQESSGLAVSTLEVIDSNGNKTKIREDQFTSSKKLPISTNISEKDDDYIVYQAKQDQIVDKTSIDNLKIYNKFRSALEKLIH